MQPADDGLDRDAAAGVSLRIEKHFDMTDVVGAGALQVGPRQVEKILFAQQHRHAPVVHVEEVLKLRELVGYAQRLDRFKREADVVARRKREHELRLERSLDVNVELAFRKSGYQRVERHSLHLEAGGADHLFPFHQLGLDLGCELFGRVGDHLESHFAKAFLHVRQRDDLDDLAMKLRNDILRRSGRHQKGEPQFSLAISG